MLQRLVGGGSYEKLKTGHSSWIEDYLGDESKNRQYEWTESIAVGDIFYLEKLKSLLGFRAEGRKIKEGGEGYQLREDPATYNAFFEAEKEDIGPENTHLWNINH